MSHCLSRGVDWLPINVQYDLIISCSVTSTNIVLYEVTNSLPMLRTKPNSATRRFQAM